MASRFRARRWLIVLLLVLVVGPGGYYVARQYAWPAYKDWREAKLARMTRQFMAKGDYDKALLTARQALRDNQRSLAHWKLAAAAAKAKNSPEAIYYQVNVVRLEKSLESRIELLKLALQYGAYRDAIEAIEGADASARQSAEFHELAARAYLGVGRPVTAKLHLYSLISIQPDNNAARLDLAEIELAGDAEGKDSGARQELETLSRVPELRSRALSLLLKDAISSNDPARARHFAEQLENDADLNAEQRVLVLSGLVRGKSEKAEAYRRQLEAGLAKDPAGVVALADYFRTAGPRDEARAWFDALPPEIRTDPAVQEAIAATFLEWKDWTRLDQAVAAGSWKDRDFMRQAFTAYSARKTSRFADAGSAWRLAVIQAGSSPRKISELLALVAHWGWQSEQYDLVWKLFALMPRNESISRQLIAWERHQGHTANLNRIFARLAEFAGDDRMIKNNLAYTSLLLNANLSKAFELANDNYQAEPSNPFYVTTQALALYKQNKAADALALLESLRPSLLSTPERALYRALFHASSGDAAQAADLLAGLKGRDLLPEERQLMVKTRSEIARIDREKGEDSRLFALGNSGEIDRSKGWLRALPDTEQATATPEMQAADSLLAMQDWRGLSALLRKGSWGEREYLRLALTTYVARHRSDESLARSYWRTAVGAAAGQPAKLDNLKALATAWNWSNERIDALAELYKSNPGDLTTFNELMNHYRAAGRTPELVGVLNAYLSMRPNDQGVRCEHAYYAMLSGLDLARAYVAAQETYKAAPEAPERRLVYAFALWKQRRTREAWELLEHTQPKSERLVPEALLRAAVLADLDRHDDAASALKGFDSNRALPEEARLAALVASRLREDSRVSRLN
jgi:hypothetical protein